jgi:hypothetical protein
MTQNGVEKNKKIGRQNQIFVRKLVVEGLTKGGKIWQ